MIADTLIFVLGIPIALGVLIAGASGANTGTSGWFSTGLVLAPLVALVGLHGGPQFPPAEATDWLLVGLVVVGSLPALERWVTLPRFVVHGVLALLVFGLIAWPRYQGTGMNTGASTCLLSSTMTYALFSFPSAPPLDEPYGKDSLLPPVSLLVWLIGSAVVIGINSSFWIAQVLLSVGVLLGVLLAVAWFTKKTFDRSAFLTVLLLSTTLVLYTALFGTIWWVTLVIFLLAPVVLFIPTLLGTARSSMGLKLLPIGLIVLLLAGGFVLDENHEDWFSDPSDGDSYRPYRQ